MSHAKYLLLIVTLLYAVPSNAKDSKIQPELISVDSTDGHYYYEKIVAIDSLKKEIIYDRLKTWVQANVKTADNNISFDDKNFSSIITTPTIALEDVNRGLYQLRRQEFNFKLVISIKDGKYKIAATGFNYYAGESTGGARFSGALETLDIPKGYAVVAARSIDDSFLRFLKSLKSAVKTKADW